MSIFKANLSPFSNGTYSDRLAFHYSPVTPNVRVRHHTDMSECPVINMRRQRWTWSSIAAAGSVAFRRAPCVGFAACFLVAGFQKCLF